MPYYKFGKNDIFYNTLETHPKCKFLVHNNKTYYNEQIPETSPYPAGTPSHPKNIDHVKSGDISLYEMNVNREEFEGVDSIYLASYPAASYISVKQTNVNQVDGPLTFPGSFSMSGWIKKTDDGGQPIFISHDGGEYCRIGHHNDDTHRKKLYCQYGSNLFSETEIVDGNWHHWVKVRNSETGYAHLYVDGKLEDTVRLGAKYRNRKFEPHIPKDSTGTTSRCHGVHAPGNPIVDSNGDTHGYFHIGSYIKLHNKYREDPSNRNECCPQEPGYVEGTVCIGGTKDEEYDPPKAGDAGHLNGSIADVAMWNTALDDDAVRNIYNNGKPIDLTKSYRNYTQNGSLVGYWRMNNIQDENASPLVVTDLSGYGAHGTISTSNTEDPTPPDMSIISAAFQEKYSPKVYPFITKDGTALTFKTVDKHTYQEFPAGDKISGQYPLAAGISIERFAINGARPHIDALRNTLNYYKIYSKYYSYDNVKTKAAALISIPSIFYGSSIEKGSVTLERYTAGDLTRQIVDSNKNGELLEVTAGEPDKSKVAGVVLYNEGFIVLFDNSFGANSSWQEWGTSAVCSDPTKLNIDECLCAAAGATYLVDTPGECSEGSTTINTWDINPEIADTLSFNGTNRIPSITMLAHARKGELNHSNNPTYLTYGQSNANIRGNIGTVYEENKDLTIANTVQSPHSDFEAPLEKQTWISKIGIYDENNNLIAIAKLANPVRKTEGRDFTFKLKLDI